MTINTLAEDSVRQITARKGVVANPADKGAAPARDNALSAIAKYIPVEIVTLFLAGISLLPTSEMKLGWLTPSSLLWSLVVFTPFCFCFIFIGKYRAQSVGNPWPQLREYPWWKILAATIAFYVWAHAVPGAKLTADDMVKVWSFGALFVSTIFTLIESMFPKN